MRHYLTLEGIPVKSPNPKYPKAMELLSWSWADPWDRDRAGAIAFMTLFNEASSQMHQFVASGRHIERGVLECVGEPGESSNKKFMRMTMTDIMFMDAHSVGYSEGGKPLDSILLSFGKYVFEFGAIPQPDKTVRPEHARLIQRLKIMKGQLRQPGGRR